MRHRIIITLFAAVAALAGGAPAQAWGGIYIGAGFGYYGPGFGWYGPPFWGWGYYPYYYDATPGVRLQVKPKQALVYVDGYYAGIVDDFDGSSQRVRVPPGRHEITLKFEGFKTHRVMVFAAIGNTLKYRYDLVQGSGEDTPEDLAAGLKKADAAPPASVPPAPVPPAEAPSATGQIRLRVLPDDASIYVDGQLRGPGRDVGSLELSPGHHRVQVVRPGFRSFDHEVEVEPGRATELNVEMERR
jgi:hypothetical protein